jgi:molecular chaperone GrpE
MIDSDRKTAAQEVEEPEATDPSAGDESRADGTIEELLAPAAEMEQLEAEKADLTERLVRLAADMDNLRKRTERDVADARKYAVTKFAADMLVVGDNLKRALEAVPADRRESDEDLKALAEGVDMTAREMERMLQKNNIMPIPALGERFDPHLHQAMFEVPDQSVPAGTVVQVMQEGYQIGDRVLRAALVGVSKGGPAASPPEPGPADAADSPE